MMQPLFWEQSEIQVCFPFSRRWRNKERQNRRRNDGFARSFQHGFTSAIPWLLWYNRARMHSTLNYVSPVQFEQDWTDAMMKIAA
jgi:transposase InsO family protein